jgi:hypothetical protein
VGAGGSPAECCVFAPNCIWLPARLLESRYVYAVISPRARGLSIGVNLNPDSDCVHVRAMGRTPSFKIVLITNASHLDAPQVQQGTETVYVAQTNRERNSMPMRSR